jgi:hypothetical protein
VSLTTELKNRDSRPSLFMRVWAPNVRPIYRSWRKQLDGTDTAYPPFTFFIKPPWGPIGAALDYRLRYYFAATPGRQLVAAKGAARLALQGRSPAGELAEEFFERLDGLVQELRPASRRLARNDEMELCRYCYILALYEAFARPIFHAWRSPFTSLKPTARLKDLLALAERPWVQDVRDLSWTFYDNYGYLLSRPAVLNPTFAGSSWVDGADADLIVGGCLIDIKCTVKPGPSRMAVYQLLGYALLDDGDRHGIRSLGIYLARQGVLVEWPVTAFVQVVTEEWYPSLISLRSSLKEWLGVEPQPPWRNPFGPAARETQGKN